MKGYLKKKELSDIIQQEKFTLSESKFRITKIGQAHYVTGLSISDNTPHAPRSFKKKLRQELYYCKKFGIKSHLLKLLGGSNEECLMGGEGIEIQRGINRIHGTVCYVSHIEESPQLLRSWFDLVKNNKCNITYVDRVNFKEVSEEYLASVNPRQEHNQEYNIVEFYIDETEIEYENERKFLAVAFTAIEQNKIQNISESIKKILEDNIADPFTGGNKTKLKKINYIFSMQIGCYKLSV